MIDLSTWELTIPEGTPATRIGTQALARGFSDEYFHADSGSLFFWAPVTGTLTPNTHYPRTELRETSADGRLRNWAYRDADNSLHANLAVNQVPSSGSIVIGQIHVDHDSKPLLKLEYRYKAASHTGSIVAQVRADDPQAKNGALVVIARNVQLDQHFSYNIHLTPNGTLSLSAADGNWETPLNPAWANKQLYFKAGVYVQDNHGGANEGGRATFYELAIKHTPA
ncbi:polysaccharide lyase family 7 protein [Pseudomonas gingeri]|uniref:polysaccharide lyase family 7 protein n=1 Tax=Pseudomonas gingeri TaxID=117681 RepID=UPI0015A07690|nr:polysaccharide lyase family 7 protein [Pseudomonas gingeri]NVZ64722.1 polysaccharide lyase family 7 protein [Pseudomonas gingeri]NVZ76444.1 polysaccharide lyase family 7 protein [Pseudomonas gingeri]